MVHDFFFLGTPPNPRKTKQDYRGKFRMFGRHLTIMLAISLVTPPNVTAKSTVYVIDHICSLRINYVCAPVEFHFVRTIHYSTFWLCIQHSQSLINHSSMFATQITYIYIINISMFHRTPTTISCFSYLSCNQISVSLLSSVDLLLLLLENEQIMPTSNVTLIHLYTTQ